MKFEKFIYFYPERPQLIHIEQDLFFRLDNDPDTIAEKKYNGQRLELHYLDGHFQFWNRHGAELQFEPDANLMFALRELASHLKGYCILDGELRHNKVVGVRQKIVFYDTLMWNGELLTDMTFIQRAEMLPYLETTGDPLSTPVWYTHIFEKTFNEAIEDPEIEGLVIKNMKGMLNLSRTGNQDSNWMWKVREPSGRYDF